jgi:hypothetical protein
MMRRPPLAALSLIVVAALAFAACRSSSTSNQTPTPMPSFTPDASSTAGASATPNATPTPSTQIRLINLGNTAPVQKAIADSGGQLVQSEVIYADLTGEGAEDAIVPISSGGTLGDIAVVVLLPVGGATRTLLSYYPRDGRGMAVAVLGNRLVITEPVPGPDDPLCCPSQLRKTVYGWNGVALVAESVTTAANPNGGSKAAPAATMTP